MPARPAQDARVRIEEDGVEREVSAAEAIATLSARRTGECRSSDRVSDADAAQGWSRR
jgi:hypothetical protein